MKKYLNILQKNNSSTCNDMIKILSELLQEMNLQNYTFKDFSLLTPIIETKVKKYSKENNKKIKVFYSVVNVSTGLDIVAFEFKLDNLKIMASYKVNEKMGFLLNSFCLSNQKNEIMIDEKGIDWFFLKRKHFAYLKVTEEETVFKIVMDNRSKNGYLQKIGFDEVLSKDTNKYPEAVADFLLLKKDFSSDFIEECLIVDDYSLSLDKEKLSKITIDISSIKF